MKKQNKIHRSSSNWITLMLVSFLSVINYSCDSFVEVELPNSQLTAEAVYQNKATAVAAMSSIHAKMRDNGLLTGSSSGLSHAMGLYADELELFGTQVGPQAYYNNAVVATSGVNRALWNTSFNQIYDTNALIEGVTQSTALTTTDKNELIGEALVVRALIHFYLTNLYGSIPYIKTTNFTQNTSVSKVTTAQIYALAIEDLEMAVSLLPESYPSTGRIRPNKFTARALLARINLYASNWAEAANDASAVLNHTQLYALDTNIDNEFLKTNTGIIWAFIPANNITLEGISFQFTSLPPPLSSISNELINAFEPGDLRKTKWTKAVTNGTDTRYHPFKYKQGSGGTATEHSIVLRVAELYLIRAEARANEGDLIGAKEDLNRIRNRAGLPNATAVTQEEILNAILKEREAELFTEHGHRFFDLKRTNQINEVLNFKPGWDSTDALLPIPEAELILNPNLNPQNPGY